MHILTYYMYQEVVLERGMRHPWLGMGCGCGFPQIPPWWCSMHPPWMPAVGPSTQGDQSGPAGGHRPSESYEGDSWSKPTTPDARRPALSYAGRRKKKEDQDAKRKPKEAADFFWKISHQEMMGMEMEVKVLRIHLQQHLRSDLC